MNERRKRMIRHGTLSGFTLVEVLTVVLIIMILAGMVTSAFHVARKKALVQGRDVQKVAISSAIQQYRFEYQKWPCPEPADPNMAPDQVYSNDNKIVIQDYLMKQAAGKNVHGIRFLNVGDFKFDSNQNIVDYNKQPFKITISFSNDTVSVE